MGPSSKFIIHHRDYDFPLDGLSDVIAPNFLKAITKLGNQRLPKYSISTVRQYVKGLEVYGEYHRQNLSHRASPITTILSAGIVITDNMGEWIADLMQFHDYLDRNHTQRMKEQHAAGLNWWLRHMSTTLICPANLNLTIKKGANSGAGTKTILDFALTKEAEKALAGAIGHDPNAAELSNEAHRLYQHICVSLDQDPHTPCSLNELPVLAQAVLQKRLNDLRNEVQKVFNAGRQKRLEGLLMIRRGRQGHLKLLVEWTRWRKGNGAGNRNPWSEAVSELSDGEFLDAHLAWCMDEHELKGLSPKSELTETRIYNVIRKEIQRRDLGLDAKVYQEYMGASHNLLVSGYLMLIHDLVANPGSISHLSVNADYKTICNLAGVDWEKKRAQKILTLLDGKAVDGQTPPSKVVSTIRKATRHYRQHCVPADKDYLFLLNYQNKARSKGRNTGDPINKPSGNWFNDQAQALIAKSTGAKSTGAKSTGAKSTGTKSTGAEWQGTALSVRASLLLLEGLKEGVGAAQKKGQHSDTRTTTGYLNKLPMKLQHEAKIRAFMEWLEALVAIDIEDFAAKVGLDPVEFKKRREEVLNSQFGGLHCRDNTSGYQPGSEVGQPCTRIDKCLTCEKRRNLFIATENNVLHLLLWNDALRLAQANNWIDKGADWLLWSAFIDSMLTRLQKNSKHRAVLAGAQQALKKVGNNPYLRVFGCTQTHKTEVA